MNNSEYRRTVKLRPYTFKELHILYGLTYYVFTKWIETISEDLGPRVAGFYSIKQVQFIFDTYGIPGQEIIFY